MLEVVSLQLCLWLMNGHTIHSNGVAPLYLTVCEDYHITSSAVVSMIASSAPSAFPSIHSLHSWVLEWLWWTDLGSRQYISKECLIKCCRPRCHFAQLCLQLPSSTQSHAWSWYLWLLVYSPLILCSGYFMSAANFMNNFHYWKYEAVQMFLRSTGTSLPLSKCHLCSQGSPTEPHSGLHPAFCIVWAVLVHTWTQNAEWEFGT